VVVAAHFQGHAARAVVDEGGADRIGAELVNHPAAVDVPLPATLKKAEPRIPGGGAALLGCFESGTGLAVNGRPRARLPEFEHRLASNDLVQSFARPRWDGSYLAGRTILVYPERGLGDTIHLVRYLPLLQRKGGRVVFACPKPLMRLLNRSPGIDLLVPEGSDPPGFDVHVPLMSLPYLLGTTLPTIPADVPYVFPDETRVQLWGQVLRWLPSFNVGIAWQGNPRFKSDRTRSLALRHFAPLARIPGVRLVSLQQNKGHEQLAQADFPVLELGSDLDRSGAFTDTAAVMKHLDLIIACDTAIGHLAGSIGVPVWIALSLACDWRWMRGREDSPWYPTVRLFRQKEPGDWLGVFARMAEELGRIVAARPGPLPPPATEPVTPDAAVLDPVVLALRLHALGAGLARQGCLDEAAACLREALQHDPSSADGNGTLGLITLRQGRPQEAVLSANDAGGGSALPEIDPLLGRRNGTSRVCLDGAQGRTCRTAPAPPRWECRADRLRSRTTRASPTVAPYGS
jgi:hypothetical protein